MARRNRHREKRPTMTLDEYASFYGLVRTVGESDDDLKHRIEDMIVDLDDDLDWDLN